MFWNLLRTAPEHYTCYCEPFHESLPHLVDDPALVPPDITHSDIDDPFAEYRALDPVTLKALWRPWFGRERFVLGPEDPAPEMKSFLDFLVGSSDSPVVIKFTRASFRIRWLRAQFPSARIVQLIRRPRDMWTSMGGRGRPLRGERFGTFMEYTDMMARDIGFSVIGDPYRTFYALTKLADACADGVTDDRWEYESAVLDPRNWALRHLVEPGLVREVPSVVFRTDSLGSEGHSSEWFDAQEEATKGSLGSPLTSF
jgi:hypothetical protein